MKFEITPSAGSSLERVTRWSTMDPAEHAIIGLQKPKVDPRTLQ